MGTPLDGYMCEYPECKTGARAVLESGEYRCLPHVPVQITIYRDGGAIDDVGRDDGGMLDWQTDPCDYCDRQLPHHEPFCENMTDTGPPLPRQPELR